jgi:hypothetical protein
MRHFRLASHALAVVVLLGGTSMVLAEDAVEPATEAKTEAKAEAKTETRTSTQLDRLNLDTSSITGSQELPKILYIVPWKQAGIGDLTGKPVNSLLDEVLTPLDRDVFRRQVRYFDQLYVATQDGTDQE